MSKMLKVVGASWLRTKVSSYILGLLGVLAILALFVGQIERSQEDGNYAATVFFSEKTGYRIEYWGQSNDLADLPRGVARAYFREDIDTTGWSLLEVETDSSYRDDVQAYAAGIVEGALTWSLIHSHLQNTVKASCNSRQLDKQCDKIRDALDKSVNIWKTRAAEKESADPFWHHVSLHYTQIHGIHTGWKYGIERSMSEYEADISDLYWINSYEEVTEIQRKLNISLGVSRPVRLPALSSALVSIVNTTEDGASGKNVYIAHNAEGSYSSMTRILKRYKLNFHMTAKDKTLAAGSTVEFSGFPGSVTSQDEFYLIQGEKHRMCVTGTTLNNYNDQLWKDVNINEQIPLGPRITAANHLALNVSSWAHHLATSNSGTGCKQWLVLHLSRLQDLHEGNYNTLRTSKTETVVEITENNAVRHTARRTVGARTSAAGLLLLLEQVPSLTHSADVTYTLLTHGYFATYGLPFFQNVANLTHVTTMEDKYGNIFSTSKSHRAVIFRNATNATSLEEVMMLMRQNQLGGINTKRNCSDDEDLVSCEIYWSVPGARGDIAGRHMQAYGVIDTKIVTGNTKDAHMDFVAISSPPFTKPMEINTPKINKGNIASSYTDQLDNKPNINGLMIRDLVKQHQEEAEQESLEIFNSNHIQPFQWSLSQFNASTHDGLPDLWAFGPFKPNWSW